MNQKIRLQTFDRDDGPEPKEIADHLRAEVESEFGPADRRAVWISAHDGGRLVGGLRGFSHWGWLYIAQLWVDEAVRAQGVGAELLKAAETEARARGCA